MSDELEKIEPSALLLATRPTDLSGDLHLDTCKLVQTSGEEKGREVELVRPRVTIGSAPDCDVRVNDDTVSRRHFQIQREVRGYTVRDLDSTNGTLLDGTRVKEAVLVPGAMIRAGDVFFRCEALLARAELLPSASSSFGELKGGSYRMRLVFGLLEKVADSDATLLIEGETGTGKSAVARAIHRTSARAAEPFLVVDCGAIAPTLVESELFGHEKGAFTGAVRDRSGAFELAGRGTLFIDELTDLAPHLQAKLLRAIEEREVVRVGSHKPTKVRCRVLAASQRDLRREVDAGRFRADLYFRLAVVTVPLPPLRARKEDLPTLCDAFFAELNPREERTFAGLSPEMQQQLLAHDWPGNIRELRNTIERLSLICAGEPTLIATTLPALDRQIRDTLLGDGAATTYSTNIRLPFKEAKEQLITSFEKDYLLRKLAEVGGNVTHAARNAGLDRKHFYTLLAKYGLGGDKP